MSASSSRRAFLAGTTAIAAVPAAAAAIPHPDRELIALGQQLEELAPREEAAWTRHEDLLDAFVSPACPRALNERRGDFFLIGSPDRDHRAGPARYWSEKTIERLRTERFERYFINGGTMNEDGSFTPRAAPNEEAHARAAEIVAAYEDWQAKIAEAKEACGLTAAEAEASRLGAEHRALRIRVAELPATTLAGFVVKARSAARCFGDLEDEDFGPHADGLAAGLVRDLVRFADGHEGDR